MYRTCPARWLAALVWFLALILPAAAASENVLYSFPTEDAGEPAGRLLLRQGTLFGTTSFCCAGAYGSVFALRKQKETTLVQFDGNNASMPQAGLIADSSGALYGTSVYGGTVGLGAVFKVARSGGVWTVQTIWSFGANDGDGQLPHSDLMMDAAGNIYGTTSSGGNNAVGAVFELSPSGSGWKEKILYSFFGNADGEGPVAGVLMDRNGDLFGTTWQGGAGICKYNGCGTVFSLHQDRVRWKEQLIHVFGFGTDVRDGAYPLGTLIADSAGALYGTTEGGGAHGAGTVFKVSTAEHGWRLETLYDFAGGGDGANPMAGLARGPRGTFYGTTEHGGANNAGTVFALRRSRGSWSESVLHVFGGSGDGSTPLASVIVDKAGTLFGTTYYGGANDDGIVFSLIPQPNEGEP